MCPVREDEIMTVLVQIQISKQTLNYGFVFLPKHKKSQGNI